MAKPKVIWDKKRNSTPYVSDKLGIERSQLRKALHKIKARNNLGGVDRTVTHEDGSVTHNGELIGNIHDED